MQKLDVTEIGRKRSPNFTHRENRILAELVKNYEEQIECKKTDNISNICKIRAWDELAKDFNSRVDRDHDHYRSATVLRHRYENIKKEIRRSLRKRLQSGDSVNSDTNILENLPSYVSGSEDAEMDTASDIKDVIEINLSSDEAINHDRFENFNRSSPERGGNAQPPLSPKREEKVPVNMWDNTAADFEELRKRCFLEEHRLKLQHMKEKHHLELELIRMDHKEKIKILREEHETKMELLELEKSVGIINKM